ncbi:DNA-protecting protein DprA [Candidatus Poribacteria bacterium]|nr:DNA-protecting protein DprA [Candidatus Poribacteria bacterium]
MVQRVHISKCAYWLALASVDGVGMKKLKQLIARFDSLEKVFEASLSQIACLPRFNPLLASKILQAGRRLNNFQRQIDWLKSRGIEILCFEDERYPTLLKEISDAPLILCKKGNLKKFSKHAVAIVGTRTPTKEGLAVTRKLAMLLASEGCVIVSGLAKGIDTAAHKGAIDANGVTVGVLGCDIQTIYPKENIPLANSICANGTLVSEHPFDTQPTSVNLMQRNRIISGISLGTIVIEANEDDGAIQTARFAQNQNRRVYAYHWPSNRPLTSGLLKLMADGATGIKISNVSNLLADLLKTEEGKFSIEKKDKQLELF